MGMYVYSSLFPLSNKSIGEEYQVVKRGREYHGIGKEYNVEESERASK